MLANLPMHAASVDLRQCIELTLRRVVHLAESSTAQLDPEDMLSAFKSLESLALQCQAMTWALAAQGTEVPHG